MPAPARDAHAAKSRRSSSAAMHPIRGRHAQSAHIGTGRLRWRHPHITPIAQEGWRLPVDSRVTAVQRLRPRASENPRSCRRLPTRGV
eukprot:365028-Chlamydomonas_euryale.AAC.16